MEMTHPPDLHERFGKSKKEFEATFEDKGNGTFIAKKSFDFVHAVGTTLDKPTTIATDTKTGTPKRGQDAGDLWFRITRRRITDSKCAVQTCTNKKCAEDPQPAKATAHVYLTSQKSDDPIEDMVLLPTCGACNSHKQSAKCGTQYPEEGQEANPLTARPGTEVIFIETNDHTAQKKGDQGRPKGKGGTFGEPYSRDGGKGSSGGGDGGKGSGKGGSGKGSTPY